MRLDFVTALACAHLLFAAVPVSALDSSPSLLQMAQRASCKAATSCQDAVAMWCGGYRAADADGDGIPCENVCRSRSQVEGIRKQIGC